MYALSPTQIFAQSFGQNVCTVAIAFGRLDTRDAKIHYDVEEAVVTGLLVGICVLEGWRRTCCQYSALLWFGDGGGENGLDAKCRTGPWDELMVAPYSTYATNKFGSFMISDRTLGQMMWLGIMILSP